MTLSGKYLKTNPELLDVNSLDYRLSSIIGYQHEEKVYTYDEAIDLAGNGWYIFALSVVLAVALTGMTLDIFGFSVVVTSACDLELTHSQESILLSMPFLGSIFMAYPWGYIADTQGRLKGLLISLYGSYIFASLSAFSPNWIVLAVLKFCSSSFSSGIQSLSLTLLGETCSLKLKGPLLIGVLSALFLTFTIYNGCAYLILGLDLAFDLGFIVFKPWRLLALVLALPLGIPAVFLGIFFESPKFLLNDGREKKALKLLKKISEKNGVKVDKYPVKKVVLNETTSLRRKDISLLQSLMEQTFPLFKPPLLNRLVQLFYLTAVVYATNNGFYSWLPFINNSFNYGYGDNITADNMCGLINSYKEINYNNSSICIATVTKFTVWISVFQGVLYTLMNSVISSLSRWKKTVLMAQFFISFLCGVLVPIVPGRISSICLFYGFMINSLSMTIVFSYFVDLFPTSYRGMAACLGVMVARISALVGSHIVGTYLASHCVTSMYAWSVYVLSGFIVASFLPANPPKI